MLRCFHERGLGPACSIGPERPHNSIGTPIGVYLTVGLPKWTNKRDIPVPSWYRPFNHGFLVCHIGMADAEGENVILDGAEDPLYAIAWNEGY